MDSLNDILSSQKIVIGVDSKGCEFFVGDKIKATTDWDLGCGEIFGKVIYNNEKYCFCIEGTIYENNCCFPIYDCWELEVL